MKLRVCLLVICLTLTQAAYSAVIFSENFDTLTAGNLNGQGGWTLNTSGTMLVVNNSSVAYSTPNYMALGNSGAVQHTYTSTDLNTDSTSLGFYFLQGATTSGHNIQLSMRTTTSGNASVFYLNLLGAGTGLQAGTSSSSFSSSTYSSALSANTWYRFSATTNPVTDVLSFNVALASGGSALTSGTVDISGTAEVTARMVFSSNASTLASDWAIDNISFATVPEPQTVALILGGLGMVVLRCRRMARKMQTTK